MGCYHPVPAYRTPQGAIKFWHAVPDSVPLRLPCGGCIGCRTSYAKAWALRCQLELQQHDRGSFTTLTYDNDHVPGTLSKRDLQLYIKRVRKALGAGRPLRFFACGEYGETNRRPHYHAILYGVDVRDRELLDDAWGIGRTQTVNVTPGAIAYTAGYTSKKIGDHARYADVIDYETGELLYEWQPPFLQMSRRPGIGGHARQFVNSWRSFAVQNGYRMAVPRFLHEAWKRDASPQDLEDLAYEKYQLSVKRDHSIERLVAGERIAVSRQSLDADRRRL